MPNQMPRSLDTNRVRVDDICGIADKFEFLTDSQQVMGCGVVAVTRNLEHDLDRISSGIEAIDQRKTVARKFGFRESEEAHDRNRRGAFKAIVFKEVSEIRPRRRGKTTGERFEDAGGEASQRLFGDVERGITGVAMLVQLRSMASGIEFRNLDIVEISEDRTV